MLATPVSDHVKQVLAEAFLEHGLPTRIEMGYGAYSAVCGESIACWEIAFAPPRPHWSPPGGVATPWGAVPIVLRPWADPDRIVAVH